MTPPPRLNGRRQPLLALALVAGALTGSGALYAQPSSGNGPPPAPPAEALQACKSASSGQACSFTSSQGSTTGTCWAPEGKALACKPKGGPGEKSSSSSK